MTIKIYNSLTRKKEDFIPVEEGKVKMYVCGMTVYSDAHIGHARTYFAFDIIRRYFEFKGFVVTYIQNITDVDDKIINAANKKGIDALEYSKKFTERSLTDLDDLGIRKADIYPKASETVPDMINMTQQIIDKGIGYESQGDVYFSVDKFPEYGKLSGQKLDDLIEGARIHPGETKKNPLDFALWKKSKPGEPSWDSPWGKGRPGWHIECSAMSSKYLGLPFDIHGGGMDLRFPHHENEIAQAEAATGKNFAKYWMHIGLLTIEGDKMSKSLGNIINVKNLLEKWDSEIIRFFFAQTHYRSPPDFNERALEKAEKGLIRIHRLKEKLVNMSGKSICKEINEKDISSIEMEYFKIITDFKLHFEKAMDDDFNTPKAVSSIFNFVNLSNKYFKENDNISEKLASFALEILLKIGNVLTLFQKKSTKGEDDKELFEKIKNIVKKYDNTVVFDNFEKLIDVLLHIREDARNKKDWNKADSIRNDLENLGFEIQDTTEGPVWRIK
jgi:cysteinyl-tRNA synthetase